MARRWKFSALRLAQPRILIAAIAVCVFAFGALWQNANLLAVGAMVLCFLLRRIGIAENSQNANTLRREVDGNREADRLDSSSPKDLREFSAPDEELTLTHLEQHSVSPQDTDALVDELLTDGRYSLMLRPQTKEHLTQPQLRRAIRQLDECMALVPAGRVLIGQLAELANSSCGQPELDPKMLQRGLVSIGPVYLDRFCVTNADYQRFVDALGYEKLEHWHEEALPALLDFVDQSGAPGPRYWIDGQYPADEQRLPVVGISWYEACAYARWVGKRLPEDAEWTKAAAWPVESSPGRIAQRRYPWGESFDVRRAHLYGSGRLAPVAVDEFPSGTSVGGVHQLIGNVWEWTATPLAHVADPTLHVSESVMSIRGGAFDTYFENQATSHYQSGEHALSRRPNIGFRLALRLSDLEAPNDGELQYELPDSEEPQQLDAPAMATS
jgi:gamma-glutamyl hercynylcysteine S-oxide synthase